MGSRRPDEHATTQYHVPGNYPRLCLTRKKEEMAQARRRRASRGIDKYRIALPSYIQQFAQLYYCDTQHPGRVGPLQWSAGATHQWGTSQRYSRNTWKALPPNMAPRINASSCGNRCSCSAAPYLPFPPNFTTTIVVKFKGNHETGP